MTALQQELEVTKEKLKEEEEISEDLKIDQKHLHQQIVCGVTLFTSLSFLLSLSAPLFTSRYFSLSRSHLFFSRLFILFSSLMFRQAQLQEEISKQQDHVTELTVEREELQGKLAEMEESKKVLFILLFFFLLLLLLFLS